MRNLKKILALVLALVMSMSLMATANAFDDADDIDADYAEAVEVLAALEVFKGRTADTFAPDANIKRAEVAAIIYRIVTGDVDDKQVGIYADYNKFTDVPSTAWYAGYVNYCANAEYIKGCGDGTFGPEDTVTGYQALAMILRAVGYDQNGEFTGSAWQVKTASVGKELGITDNVTAGTLGTAATREVVAEILFQAILVDQVDYTVAFGYSTRGNNSIGWDTFELEDEGVSEDVFGRPGALWNAFGKKLVFIPDEAVASYVVAVDECDIANDMGLKKTTDIESLWIDGIVDNKANDGEIDPYSTRKNVGAQGRLTEVYDMGKDGVRIVEINTYLAKVVGVKNASTDKNGHTKDAYVTFEIYEDDAKIDIDDLTYETEDFVKGQYALVTVSQPGTKDEAIESAEAVAAETIGYTTDWDKSTTTIGKTEYDDADKFVLNKEDVKSAKDICWDVFVDQYGNIIGAVKTGTNYLVIEKIEWKHSASSVGDGYALADIVLADGTKEEDVKIVEINGEDANNDTAGREGDVEDGAVTDDYTDNDDYYDHIFTYTVDEDGDYSIDAHIDVEDKDNKYFAHDEDVEVVNGQATIGGNTNKVVATSTTVYLVEDANGYTYTVYVGKNEVPSGTAAEMCALTDDDGYATLVILNDFTPAGNAFFAYVTDATVDGNSRSLGAKHKVYKMGETDATIVYDDADDEFVFADAFTKTGIYEIELNNKGQIVKMSSDMVADLAVAEDYVGDAWSEDGLDYNRALVEGKENNTSFSTQEYTGLETDEDSDNGYTADGADAWKDFNADEETVVIKVTKDGFNGKAKLSDGDMDDVNKGDVIIVGYTSRNSGKFNNAEIIYVMINDDVADPVEETQGTIEVTVTIVDPNSGNPTKNGVFHNELVRDAGTHTLTALGQAELAGLNKAKLAPYGLTSKTIELEAGETVEVELYVYYID